MMNLLRELTKEFRLVEKESYHHKNTSDKMHYPYLTFDISEEVLTRNTSGFYLDINTIDSNSSYSNLLTLESNLKAHFKGRGIFTDDLYIRFEYLNGRTFDSQDDTLKRRILQIYCKVDWRSL